MCIQYLDPDANVKVRALALIELHQGTADAITESIFDYLHVAASSLDQERLVGGACDGASVMVGPLTGVVARIKVKLPNFFSYSLCCSPVIFSCC